MARRKKMMEPERKERARNGQTEPVYREDKKCFELRFTYTDVDGKKKRKSFSAQSKPECEQKRELFLLNLEKEKNGVALYSTIPEILTIRNEKRLKANKQKEQGYGRNMDTISYIAKSSIGDIPIKDITKDQLENFLYEITRYAQDTIDKIYRMVKRAFETAYEKNIIDTNPFAVKDHDLDEPESSKPTKEVPPLTVEEQNIFETALKEYSQTKTTRNKYHHQFIIELYSGMRMGEINALTPRDIDFKNEVIHVSKTISRDRKKKPILSYRTKTKTSKREVPMQPEVVEELKKAIDEMIPNERNLIFCDKKTKGLITTQRVNCAYKRIFEKAGLKDKYTEQDLESVQLGQHQLRHTYGTRCVEAGMDYKALSEIMGHKDIHVTIDTYVSTLNKSRAENMKKVRNYLQSIKN